MLSGDAMKSGSALRWTHTWFPNWKECPVIVKVVVVVHEAAEVDWRGERKRWTKRVMVPKSKSQVSLLVHGDQRAMACLALKWRRVCQGPNVVKKVHICIKK